MDHLGYEEWSDFVIFSSHVPAEWVDRAIEQGLSRASRTLRTHGKIRSRL